MTSERDDVATFDLIFETHRAAVHAYFVGRTSDADAPDLLQETFLRVWRHLPDVRALGADRQRAWIFTAARNLTVDTYRSRAARDSAVNRLPAPAPDHYGPEEVALASERMAVLDEAIRQLPEPLRVVIAMHAMSGLNSAEIGAALDIPAGTVRYRLSLARKQLAEALQRTTATTNQKG